MSSDEYARAWGSDAASGYLLQTRPGASVSAVRAEVAHVLGPNAGLVVETEAARLRRIHTSTRAGLVRLSEIRLLLLIAVVLALVGAMAAVIWQRRDLVASIKCEGYTRAVLWRWLCLENALLIVVGSSMGALFGLYGELLATHFTATTSGFPVVYNVGFMGALTSFVLVSAIAIAVVALPGYLVARTPPRAVGPAY